MSKFIIEHTLKRCSTAFLYELILDIFASGKSDKEHTAAKQAYIEELKSRGYSPVEPFVQKLDENQQKAIQELAGIISVFAKRRTLLSDQCKKLRANSITSSVKLKENKEYQSAKHLNKSLEIAISEARRQIEIVVSKGPVFIEQETMTELRRIHAQL